MVKPNGTDLMCGMLRFTTLIDNLIDFQEVTTEGKCLKTPKALPINHLTTRIRATVGKYLKTH